MDKDSARKGIWLLIVNGNVEKEIYNEEEAISQFEIYTEKGSDTKGAEVELVRVLRTTKLNEYKNLDTYGDWKISPSIEGINSK